MGRYLISYALIISETFKLYLYLITELISWIDFFWDNSDVHDVGWRAPQSMRWSDVHHTAWGGVTCTTLHKVEWRASHSMRWSDVHHTAWGRVMCVTLHEVEWCASHCMRRSDVHHTEWGGVMCITLHEVELCASHCMRWSDVHHPAWRGVTVQNPTHVYIGWPPTESQAQEVFPRSFPWRNENTGPF